MKVLRRLKVYLVVILVWSVLWATVWLMLGTAPPWWVGAALGAFVGYKASRWAGRLYP